MTLELIEDARGDSRNAETLARIADLAYYAEAEGLPAFQNDLGLTGKLFSAGNTQAYVLSNDEHIVVAFRGTEAPTSLEGIKDWLLTDAVNLLILPEGDLGTDFVAAGVGARWHQGFMRALADIWDPVVAEVQALREQSDRPIWVTGHSLGGALALIAAWRFKRKFIPVHQVYTFGAPMIGNEEASKAVDRELDGRIYRYVNSMDPVPLLPTVSLIANQYGHCQKEIPLGAVAEAAAVLDTFKSLAGKTVDGLLKGSIIDEVWQALQARIGAHAMEKYRALITEQFKKS